MWNSLGSQSTNSSEVSVTNEQRNGCEMRWLNIKQNNVGVKDDIVTATKWKP